MTVITITLRPNLAHRIVNSSLGHIFESYWSVLRIIHIHLDSVQKTNKKSLKKQPPKKCKYERPMNAIS